MPIPSDFFRLIKDDVRKIGRALLHLDCCYCGKPFINDEPRVTVLGFHVYVAHERCVPKEDLIGQG